MRHRHRPIKGRDLCGGYTYCVNPAHCDPRAHGCVMEVDFCTCGATRATNVNGNWSERGPWKEAKCDTPEQ